MGVQYYTQVPWDTTLIDVEITDIDNPLVKGLVQNAVQITAGAPTATVGKFMPGAKIYNANDGGEYRNTGTTAAPVWSPIPTTASAFSLPSTESDTTTTTGTSIAWSFTTLTTGIAQALTAAALTTGKIYRAVATAATLTTGRYFEAFDGATNVWGIGANGHIHTAQTTAPTIAVTTQAGITAAAITAGASDTCGIITTTGTSTGATILDVTFNKTYTVAPKSVVLVPANAAAAMPNTGYFVSAVSATGFTITVAAGGTYAATPSFRYTVIA